MANKSKRKDIDKKEEVKATKGKKKKVALPRDDA
jgi:hypothetical protein